MHPRTLLTGILLLLTLSIYGKSPSFRQLEEKVYRLNNALKYKESQALLLPLLQREGLSADDKYHAAVLLSYTYKRVYDYEATLRFLETARQFAKKTAKKEAYLALIQGQEAFVYFDINQYQKADSVMRILAKADFRYIDLENKSKLVMQQGYLLFLGKDYPAAEATYDRAIGWMQTADPCDLPMIYVKKMQLYAATNRMDLLKNALRQSEQSADSCGIMKYHIYANEELLKIYKSRNDVAGIAKTSRIVDSLNGIYARAEQVAALHSQKETLLLGDKDRQVKQEQRNGSYLIGGLVAALLVVLGLLAGLFFYRRRQRAMEQEFVQMKAELERYLALSKTVAPATKSFLKKPAFSGLSDRQRDILALVAAGLSNKAIADKLSVSENTVKYHIKNVYIVLQIKDRRDLLLNMGK